jgi:hypothetical protein
LPIEPAFPQVFATQQNPPPVNESMWAISAAFIPVAFGLLLRGALVGWDNSPVDPASLGYGLFALTFAVVIRIIGDGRNLNPLALIVPIGFFQLFLAMQLGGTFDEQLSYVQLQNEIGYLKDLLHIVENGGGTDDVRVDVDGLRSLLYGLDKNNQPPSTTTYVYLGGTGIISTLALLRYGSRLGR